MRSIAFVFAVFVGFRSIGATTEHQAVHVASCSLEKFVRPDGFKGLLAERIDVYTRSPMIVKPEYKYSKGWIHLTKSKQSDWMRIVENVWVNIHRGKPTVRFDFQMTPFHSSTEVALRFKIREDGMGELTLLRDETPEPLARYSCWLGF